METEHPEINQPIDSLEAEGTVDEQSRRSVLTIAFFVLIILLATSLFIVYANKTQNKNSSIEYRDYSVGQNDTTLINTSDNHDEDINRVFLKYSGFKVEQINDFFRDATESEEWTESSRESKYVVVTSYIKDNDFIQFISYKDDGRYCDKDRLDSQLGACLFTDHLHSEPEDISGFFYITDIVYDSPECPTEQLSKLPDCILDEIKRVIDKSVDERNDVFVEKKVNWVTEKHQQDATIQYSIYRETEPTSELVEITFIEYTSSLGNLTILVSSDGEILKHYFSPILY